MSTQDIDQVIQAQPRNSLTWRDVYYQIPGKPPKTILKGVSGAIHSGQMVAILGPSGCGKTTLLNVLSGRLKQGKVYGDVQFNGQARPDNWKRLMAYVPQEDVMYKQQTVNETIKFYAMMRLPQDMPTDTKKAQVSRLLEIFDLKKIRKQHIGRGISGGEKRRISICSELIASPKLIFLDEPTTGLDAATAVSIVRSLREYVDEDNRSILLTIHQPRANLLRYFDAILVMSEGRAIYFGSIDEGLRHFEEQGFPCPEHENPADHFIDVVTINRRTPEEERQSRERVDRLASAYTSDLSNQQAPASPVAVQRRKYPVEYWRQFGLLQKRSFRILSRDYELIIGEVFSVLLISILLAFVFFQLPKDFAGIQGRIGLLFFIIVNTVFSIVTPMLPVFAIDRDILQRERYAAVHRLSAFYFTRFLSILPFFLVLYTIYSFIIYYIAGLRTDSFVYFLIFWATLMAIVFTSLSLAFLLGACIPSVQAAQILGSFVIVIFLIFAGNLANSRSVTWILRWLQYCSFIFYAYQALVQNELDGLVFENEAGKQYLEMYGLDILPIVACSLAVLGFGLIFLFLGYFALRNSTKPTMILKTRPGRPENQTLAIVPPAAQSRFPDEAE